MSKTTDRFVRLALANPEEVERIMAFVDRRAVKDFEESHGMKQKPKKPGTWPNRRQKK